MSVPLARNQALVLFVVVVLCFLLLAVRTEINSRRIAESQLAACVNGRKILEGFNRQQDALAAVERRLVANPEASDAGRQAAAERIAAYEGGKITPLPTCGDR